MYCPKCATQNLEDAKFCRSCGANIELVPQAMTGKLPDADHGRHRRRRDRHGRPDVGHGIQKVFMGLAFILIALALMFSRVGTGWWFWLLIPAFGMLGTGVAEIVTAKQQMIERSQTEAAPPQIASPLTSSLRDEIKARDTGDLLPPPSVTEGTTKLFDEARQSEK